MLDHAIAYARAGLPVIPLHGVLEDGSCTCGKERCHSPGKHPRTANGLKDATTDAKQIKKWWGPTRWPNASIGGVGGTFLCLDIDAKAGGFESLSRLIESHAPLPDTAVVLTGEYGDERGRHYWFHVPDDHGEQPSTRAGVRPGIDIRCTGGYAVMPPSMHVSGVRYEWEVGAIEDCAEAPDWVLSLVPEYVEREAAWTPDANFRMSKEVKAFLSGEATVDVGGQRDFLLQAARSVLATGRNVETAAQLLWEGWEGQGGIENCEWGDDPWTPEDVYQIVSDIFAKPPTSPLEKDFSSDQYSFDDAGNGERLVASFPEGELLFVPESNRWYIWDHEDDRFKSDDGSWVRLRWRQIAEELGRQVQMSRSETEAKALMAHAKASRMHPRVNAALSSAADIVATPIQDLDAEDFLFGVQNGVVDLKTGKLLDPAADYLITQYSPAEFDAGATSSLFDDFLERTVPDPALREYMQLAIGYTLTGATSEHSFFYVYGRPASGKTTILEALRHIMGTYGAKSDSSTFMRSNQGKSGPSEDVARLVGKRFVYTTEVEEDERLAVSLVNQLTGGDRVPARFLYAQTFEFDPKFKLWIGANNLPRVSGSARSGLWRRIKVLPFDQPLSKDERDPRLARKLREPEAAAAILAWAVEGAVRWHKSFERGKVLDEPSSVVEETQRYEREADHVNVFADEALERTNASSDRIPIADMFAHYQRWCDLEGRQQRRTQGQLARSLTGLEFESKAARHDGKVQRCWVGVSLRPMETAHGITIKGARK